MDIAKIKECTDLITEAYITYRTLFENVPDWEKMEKIAIALGNVCLVQKINDIASDIEHIKENIEEYWEMNFVNANCAEDLESFIDKCNESKLEIDKLIDRLNGCRKEIKILIDEDL